MNPFRLARSRVLTVVVVLCLSVSCVSTNLPPIGTTGAAFRPEEDEQRIWLASREAEARIIPSSFVYEDGPLEEYVERITKRLTPDSYVVARGEQVKVRVRKDPRLNASALSHGTIIVHTGLISRVDNEAQLAGVLAHEIAHVTHRHIVREARAIENRKTAANVIGLLALLGATAAAVNQANRGNYAAADAIARNVPPLLTLGLNLSFAAMVNGYSRDMEREADQEGMRLMARAGYEPRELAAMFQTMQADSPDRGTIETFFWGNHPRTAERIKTIEESGSQFTVVPQPPIATGVEFDRRVQRIRVTNAQYDAYLGRLSVARVQIEKAGAAAPVTVRPAVTAMLEGITLGSAARGARARPRDEHLADTVKQRAVASFDRAVSLAPRGSLLEADADRFKGMFLFDWEKGENERCASKPPLVRYLELRPEAPDRDAIRTRIAALQSCP
jgi:predicted Zn-dependent protease